MPETKPKRVVGRPFPKGVSGNPGGRKQDEARQLAKTYTREAVLRLVAIMRDKRNVAAAGKAAVALLDRGWGKPAQQLTVGEGAGRVTVIIRKSPDVPAQPVGKTWEGGRLVNGGDVINLEPTKALTHDPSPRFPRNGGGP